MRKELYIQILTVAVAISMTPSHHVGAFLHPHPAMLLKPDTFNQNDRVATQYFGGRKSFMISTMPRTNIHDRRVQSSSTSFDDNKEPTPNRNDLVVPLMTLASGHVISQALNVFVQLHIADILQSDTLTIDEIASRIPKQNQQSSKDMYLDIENGDNNDIKDETYHKVRKEALFRVMRLMAAVGVVIESEELSSNDNIDVGKKLQLSIIDTFKFELTEMGSLLQVEQSGTPRSPSSNSRSNPSLASCVQHLTEKPLWDAWLELPDYISGNSEQVHHDNHEISNDSPPSSTTTPKPYSSQLPFDRANGQSADNFYNPKTNPQSLQYANDFARNIHEQEISAVLDGFDWNSLSNKTVVDVGGYNGKVMECVVARYPDVNCIALDLEEVVQQAASSESDNASKKIQLVAGDVRDPSTIPSCDAIFLKHILDKSMWSEKESIQVLKSCYDALPDHGIVIIAEAVFPNAGESGEILNFAMDVQFLLVGRESGRTKREWETLASKAGFYIQMINPTPIITSYIIVMAKRSIS